MRTFWPCRFWRFTRGSAFFAIAALVWALVAGAPALVAQTSPAISGTVRLLSQTPWVTGGSAFSMNVAVTTSGSLDQVDLVETVFSELPNRSSFLQSLNDRILGTPLIVERHSLTEILGPSGTAQISLPVEDPQQRRYYLRDNGVYPVSVELRDSGGSRIIDHFTTHLINQLAPPPPENRLVVATVLPVDAPQTATNPLALPDNGASVSTIAKALDSYPLLPVTLVPGAQTLDRLAKSSTAPNSAAMATLTQLQGAAAGRTLLHSTWSSISPAVYDTSLSGELSRQLGRGTSVATAQLHAVDDQDWAALDPVDTNALGELRADGVKRLVVPETLLTATNRGTTLARPFTVSLGHGRDSLPAVQADAALAAHFTAAEGPVLAAHRLLADLAVIWNDRPSQLREAVVMPTRSWSPNADFLATYFEGLQDSPLLAPAQLSQVFTIPSETSGSSTLVRQLAPIPKAVTANFPDARINDNRHRLTGFGSAVTTGNAVYDSLDRQLLSADGAELTTKQRTAALDTMRSQLDKQLSTIETPPQRSLRLTARQGEIPVSIQNDTGYTVHVLIRLASDKLQFPQGSSRLLTVERHNVTERFAIDTRASGLFPVQVLVESPDGALVLARSRITVESTSTSAVGEGMSIGAGAFLVIWWIWHLTARHRARRRSTGSHYASHPQSAHHRTGDLKT